MQTRWVAKKKVNLKNINNKISQCIDSNHMTNNGNNVLLLQDELKEMFKLNNNKEVLMVCNGANGINALIGGFNIYYGKKLRWAVQSFTFPCSNQGILMDSIVMDIDSNMGPSIVELENKKDSYDGILVTNCFGCSSNISLYEKFAKENNKLLLFDNAAASMTFYKNNIIASHLNNGNGCMVSLHHTKPIGFGEGGFIVFDKEYLESMKQAICFGFTDTNRIVYNINAGNYKMSEVACIYIREYLDNLDSIYKHHTTMISAFIDMMNHNNVRLLTNYSDYDKSLLACIPLVFDKPIMIDRFIENSIEAKKYYYPLDTTHPNSNDLFSRIICLPLNMDTNIETLDKYIKIITSIINND